MIEPSDLEGLEEQVSRALRAGSEKGLRILGYGEITLVLGWPPDAPRFACKRLPLFGDEARVAAYGATLGRYLEALAAGGVDVVDTDFLHTRRHDGRVAAYVVQPILPEESLAVRVLARSEPDPEDPLVTAVLERVAGVVDEHVGLDAQISNWALAGDRVSYFDVTTPILRGSDGRPEIDLDLFLAAFPWAIRGALGRFVAPGVLARYHDRRSVMLDLAANLWKERLAPWIPAVVQAANEHVRPPLTEDEVRKDYASDARQWEWLLRLRRADRWWQRTVRRRPYPFLLPGHIDR